MAGSTPESSESKLTPKQQAGVDKFTQKLFGSKGLLGATRDAVDRDMPFNLPEDTDLSHLTEEQQAGVQRFSDLLFGNWFGGSKKS